MNQPSMNFEYNGGQTIAATRENTCIYRFFGELSMYDHIFVVTDQAKGHGIYLFRFQPEYDKAADYMMDNDYPAYINLRAVADCDKKAFADVVHREAADLEQGVPTNWKKEK